MRLIVLLLLFFSSGFVNAQTSNIDSNSVEQYNKIYILDTFWRASESYKKFSTDGYPSFLIIEDGVITLFSRCRQRTFAYESRILAINSESNSLSIIGERYFISPRRPTFEIVENESMPVRVHIFQKLGGMDMYFNGHLASEQESQALYDYLKDN